MKEKFCLGDRVKHEILGEGTIVAIDEDTILPYAVWFDKQNYLTNDLSLLEGSGLSFNIWKNCPSYEQRKKERKGYWCSKSTLSKSKNKNKKIIIYQNGTETILNYYENDQKERTVKARCHPDDEYDFLIGAKVAFEHFTIGRELINGQYVYIGETNDSFTKGKIYMFDKGYTMDDKGCKNLQLDPITEKEAQNSNSSFSKKFVKIV